MHTTQYKHRNGEVDLPTVPGWYWFDGGYNPEGVEDMQEWRYERLPVFVGVESEIIEEGEIGVLVEGQLLIAPQDFTGKWSGPIPTPWEQP